MPLFRERRVVGGALREVDLDPTRLRVQSQADHLHGHVDADPCHGEEELGSHGLARCEEIERRSGELPYAIVAKFRMNQTLRQ